MAEPGVFHLDEELVRLDVVEEDILEDKGGVFVVDDVGFCLGHFEEA